MVMSAVCIRSEGKCIPALRVRQYPHGLGLSQSEEVRCGKRGAKLWATLADTLKSRGCAPRLLRGMQGHPKVSSLG